MYIVHNNTAMKFAIDFAKIIVVFCLVQSVDQSYLNKVRALDPEALSYSIILNPICRLLDDITNMLLNGKEDNTSYHMTYFFRFCPFHNTQHKYEFFYLNSSLWRDCRCNSADEG